MTLDQILKLVDIGSTITGGVLGARAIGQSNDIAQSTADRLYGLAAGEQQRRDQLTNQVLPILSKRLRMPIGSEFSPIGSASSGQTGGGAPSTAPTLQAPAPQLTAPQQARSILGNAGTGAAIGGTVGGPIGAGIGAGVGTLIGLPSLIGADEENDWVNKVQNPFGQQVAGIIDPYVRAQDMASVTPTQQQQAQQQLEALINSYNQAAEKYKTYGTKQATTIDQSYNTLNPLFSQWRSTLAEPINTVSRIGADYRGVPANQPMTDWNYSGSGGIL